MKYIILSLIAISVSYSAHAANDFCAPFATKVAMAVAGINGSATERVEKSETSDGFIFTVTLTEQNVGEDTYIVQTSGGHDCSVLSVTLTNQPTKRP